MTTLGAQSPPATILAAGGVQKTYDLEIVDERSGIFAEFV
jgi:hypothetical protein